MGCRDAVDDWIHRYLVAWDSNQPDDVRALFAPDAAYRFHPWDEPLRGVDAIIARWTGEARDEAGDHAFTWSVIAVDGPTAVVQGRTRYDHGDVYDNLWVIELNDDGLARAFTEWYMEPPDDGQRPTDRPQG